MITYLNAANAPKSNVRRITYDLRDHSKDDLRMTISQLEESALMLSVQKII